MTNSRRRAERKREIVELRTDGAAAFAAGKPRSAAPWKPFQSTNTDHWLRGWDEAEEEARRQKQHKCDNEHARLHAAIDLFEHGGDRAVLASVLRVIADRLPHIVPNMDADDYQAIYGWGGQG